MESFTDNRTIRFLLVTCAIILTSFYFFPFEFTFLIGYNTKKIMGGIGIIVFLIQMGKGNISFMDKNMIYICTLAILVSIIGLISVTYNNTPDFTYATYIVSMLVWLSAAYVVVTFIKWIHKSVSVLLICNYLITVCVMQCILALMIDMIPSFKSFVDSFLASFGFLKGTAELTQGSRLYGIGAALDVAGTRFAAILAMIACIVNSFNETVFKKYIFLYIGAFFIITIIGNMISRTSIVGVILALVYWIYMFRIRYGVLESSTSRVWKWIIGLLIVILPVVIYFYASNDAIHSNIRFAFEGFFNWAETGEWHTNSNSILKNMYRFPETIKTWLIGDGYFENPTSDPYYIGYHWKGFYMGTDVGYLRFIFYFGLLGLMTFIAFFFKVSYTCMKKFQSQKILFIMILLTNFIVWSKVSTDLFVAFAPFLLISKEENDEYNRLIQLKS